MALAFDAASNGSGTNTASVTWSHTCTGSNLGLVVGVAAVDYGGDPTFSVTYNSVSMSDAGLISNPSLHANQFTKMGPSTGTNTVAVTIGVINCDSYCGAVSYTGVDQTAGFSTKSTATGSSTTPSVNHSSASGEVVVDTVSAANALTVDGSQTERWNGSAGVSNGGGSTEDGATTVTMSWSQTTGQWAISALAIKPAEEPWVPEQNSTYILRTVASPMIWR